MVSGENPAESRSRACRQVLTGLLFIAFLAFLLLWLFGWPTENKVRIARSTTYLTSPLRADGTIDYAAALDDTRRAQIVPADNAWIDLLRAMGIDTLPESIRAKHLRRLGIVPQALPAGRFPSLHMYSEPKDTVEATALNGALLLARTRLWAPPRLPEVAAWLTAIEPTLDAVVAASRKPGWYVPVIVVADDAPLLSLQLPQVEPVKQLADALCARALWRAESDQPEAAASDVEAAHRLARLLAQGTHTWELQQAMAIERHACEAGRVLATSGKLSAAQLRGSLTSLDQLAPFASPASMLDTGDRFVCLDLISVLAKHGQPRFESMAAVSSRVPKVPGKLVDWNVTLTEANRWYDRIVAAFGHSARKDRRSKLLDVGNDLEALEDRAYYGGRKLSGWAGPRRELGERVAEQCIYVTMPAVAAIAWDIDKTLAERELSRLVLALALYQPDHSRWPATLDELVPTYLPALPADPFSEALFVYRLSEDQKGYLLYGVGPNERNDGGRGPTDEPAGDDMTVRVP